MRRIAFPVLVILALGLLAAPTATQEKYPSRPIDFVVTWGPGGGADAMARQLMRRSLPIERTTTSPELRPTRICASTPCARRSSSE